MNRDVTFVFLLVFAVLVVVRCRFFAGFPVRRLSLRPRGCSESESDSDDDDDGDDEDDDGGDFLRLVALLVDCFCCLAVRGRCGCSNSEFDDEEDGDFLRLVPLFLFLLDGGGSPSSELFAMVLSADDLPMTKFS